jgi:hypothetical protein
MEIIELWDVKSGFPGKAQQEVIAVLCFVKRLDKLGDEDLTLSDANHVDEVGNRFGIEERSGSSQDYQGMPLIPFGRPDRDLG